MSPKDRIHVLVFPAGEINAMELHDALSSCVSVRLFGASSVDRHGPYKFERYIGGLPLIDSEDFLEKFNAVLAQYEIDVVFPTHDSVAVFLSEHRDRINAKLVLADARTTRICRSKKKTYEALSGFDFIPKTYVEISTYPVFIKPDEEQGARGARLISRKEDIPCDIDLSAYVICEYLPGEEYTVDCLSDQHGKLRVVSPRSRERTMAGVSVSGCTQPLSAEISKIAESLNGALSFLGLWFFQIKRDAAGKWKLLEVSTRCAGAMCLTRARGINLPLLSIYAVMGDEFEVHSNDYRVSVDRMLISRYRIDYDYDKVYLDFDDTLIVDDKVYLPALWLVYQCRNLGKKIYLLTKHEYDLTQTLARYAIPKSAFDGIIHLNHSQLKSDRVDPRGAIFVDNSYWERREMQKTHGIAVFDVDMIEVLMDWRT